MSAYVRPGTIEEALALLAAGVPRRSRAAPTSCRCSARGKAAGTLVDVRGLLRRRDRAQRRRARASAPARRVATSRPTRGIAEGYAALTRRPRLAASPQLRNRGTVGGQPRTARALLVLPPPRPDLLAGRRRHLLRADRRPPQARPRGRDCISVAPSDLAGALLGARARVPSRAAAASASLAHRRALRAPERGAPLVAAARAAAS